MWCIGYIAYISKINYKFYIILGINKHLVGYKREVHTNNKTTMGDGTNGFLSLDPIIKGKINIILQLRTRPLTTLAGTS